MNILVVDDHAYNRDLLAFILEEEGHIVIEAENGESACNLYKEDPTIDLVLMDINMPVLDGISATKYIKSGSKERFTPVIFITALDDSDMVSRCLEAGGDDFVPKPVNENILIAKINAHSRSTLLFNSVREANNKLKYHQQLIEREHVIVEQVFANCSYRVNTRCDNLHQYSSPMSLFNGDLLLSSPSPSGGIYFIVGDFTGHGLSAAVGSLPVSEIFFNHVARQASVARIAAQINARLYGLLPRTMFFCAVIGHLDREGAMLTVWSGGMNDIFQLSPGDEPLQRLLADHMPLGILSEQEFDDTVKMLSVKPDERFVIFTDGVNEASDAEGNEFGLARLESVVTNNRNNIVEAVKAAVNEFHSGSEQSDDISIMSLRGGPLVHRCKHSGEIKDIGRNYCSVRAFPWSFSMRLENEDLKANNPVDQVLDILATVHGIAAHLDKIFTIVSELFSNALEHGILQLDSELKQQVDGFEMYYQERQRRLLEIEGHFIQIDVRFIRNHNPNAVQIIIMDSGKGFDYKHQTSSLGSNNANCGRGIQLLLSMCSSLEYSENGTKVTAIYSFYLD